LRAKQLKKAGIFRRAGGRLDAERTLSTSDNRKISRSYRLDKVFFFFGDERNVLPDDEESNFRMALENLLKPLNIPAENVFRWQTELENVEETARDYEQRIKIFLICPKKSFRVSI
jgi:6-phosphogluconolactonase/glucosamine-6-phosphate isomerase/deaminase